MQLDGVSVDHAVVRELATQVRNPLREKLLRAVFFSSEVVAVTSGERAEILSALDRLPLKYEDVRESFLSAHASVA
jgi:hypothetical protein